MAALEVGEANGIRTHTLTILSRFTLPLVYSFIFMTDLEGFLGIEPREKEYQIFNM